MASIWAWLHEGEDGAICVYPNQRTPSFCGWAVLILSGLLFTGVVSRLLTGAAIVLVIAFGMLSWSRDVVILKPNGIVFRPFFGEAWELAFDGVKSFSRERRAEENGYVYICRLEFLIGGSFEFTDDYFGNFSGDLEALFAGRGPVKLVE